MTEPKFTKGTRVKFPAFFGAMGTSGVVEGPSSMGDDWVVVRHEPAVYTHHDGSKTLSPDLCSMMVELLEPAP